MEENLSYSENTSIKVTVDAMRVGVACSFVSMERSQLPELTGPGERKERY